MITAEEARKLSKTYKEDERLFQEEMCQIDNQIRAVGEYDHSISYIVHAEFSTDKMYDKMVDTLNNLGFDVDVLYIGGNAVKFMIRW